MGQEKTFSIICDICKGWHSTESHQRFEQAELVARHEKIEVRPNTEYRFSTLGFQVEGEGGWKPWMDAVVEKAKELGDDLQDSNFLLHIGPGASDPIGVPRGSILSVLTQESLIEAPGREGWEVPRYWNMGMHEAGAPIGSWGTHGRVKGSASSPDYDEIKEFRSLLNTQENFVHQRTLEKEKEYIDAIINFIVNREMSHYRPRPLYDNVIKEHDEEIAQLGTMEGRKRVIKGIMQSMGYARGESRVVVILKITEAMRLSSEYVIEESDKRDGHRAIWDDESLGKERERFYPDHLNRAYIIRHPDKTPFALVPDPKGRVEAGFITVQLGGDIRRRQHKGSPDEVIIESPERTPEQMQSERKFFKDLVQGLVVADGSIEEQVEVLNKMLEITKNCPERRLPIYNYYGKLIWPKPPKSESEIGGVDASS